MSPSELLKREYELAAFSGAVAAGVPPGEIMAKVKTYVDAAFATPARKAELEAAERLKRKQQQALEAAAAGDAIKDIGRLEVRDAG